MNKADREKLKERIKGKLDLIVEQGEEIIAEMASVKKEGGSRSLSLARGVEYVLSADDDFLNIKYRGKMNHTYEITISRLKK